MKTNYHFLLNNFRFLSLSLLIISLSSCSSYRNSSIDNYDGIYSSSTREITSNENQTYSQTKPNNVYVEKFNQIQEDFEESQYFTDVDAYSSNPVDTVYVVEQNYAGWGNNSSDVNINYYNNGWNNWGWNNWGWGWNSWYGPGWNNGFFYGNVGWGLGWNNWGWNNWGWNGWYGNNWGWNNWGWNGWHSPYGGYFNNNVAFNRGRRGINGNYNNAGRTTSRTATVVGRNTQIGNATVRSARTRGNTISNNPRSTTTRSNTRSTTTPTRSTTPTRTTRSSSPTRSGSSGGNIGGGRSSGGSSGGGGRSSGGGGGRSGGGGRGGRG